MGEVGLSVHLLALAPSSVRPQISPGSFISRRRLLSHQHSPAAVGTQDVDTDPRPGLRPWLRHHVASWGWPTTDALGALDSSSVMRDPAPAWGCLCRASGKAALRQVWSPRPTPESQAACRTLLQCFTVAAFFPFLNPISFCILHTFWGPLN